MILEYIFCIIICVLGSKRKANNIYLTFILLGPIS